MSLKHVGLIPDGFRRWAARNRVPEAESYAVVMRNLEAIIDPIFEAGAQLLSVYVLSKENLKRKDETLSVTLESEIRIFTHTLPKIADKWQCRVIHAGDEQSLPTMYIKALRWLCESTAHYEERKVYLCAGYNPRTEIIQAVCKSLEKHADLWQCLWVPEDVDLIIRTSGERRTSNFLPLQSGYSELHFIDKYFPDISPEDIKSAISDFYSRSRRQGL